MSGLRRAVFWGGLAAVLVLAFVAYDRARDVARVSAENAALRNRLAATWALLEVQSANYKNALDALASFYADEAERRETLLTLKGEIHTAPASADGPVAPVLKRALEGLGP